MLRPIRVLVVEDNVDAAEMLSLVLRSFDHEVSVAHDGASGLALAESWAPDLAILDIGLPVMNGYELAGRIRALPGCEHTLLVALTGYGQPADRERAKEAGFAYHLIKPIEMEQLRAILSLARSHAARIDTTGEI
jgi:CheY-like chemotaxis protein